MSPGASGSAGAFAIALPSNASAAATLARTPAPSGSGDPRLFQSASRARTRSSSARRSAMDALMTEGPAGQRSARGEVYPTRLVPREFQAEALDLTRRGASPG